MASYDILSESSTVVMKKPRRIRSNLINWDSYRLLVENDFRAYDVNIQKLRDNETLSTLDVAVSALSDSLYNAAVTLTPQNVKRQQMVGCIDQNPQTQEADHFLKMFQEGQCSLEEWESVRQEAIFHLKYNVTFKERTAWTELLTEKDSKALWNKISWKGTCDHTNISSKPTLNELSEHFQKKGQTTDGSTLLCDVTGDTYVAELDEEISVEEITDAQKCIKEDKASGDGWVKKMITNIPVCILYAIQIILNATFLHHIYPTKWRITTVNEIFKNKGQTKHAVNYRGISLVALLAKLFDFILMNRFTKWFKPSDSQTAYQSKKSSADHVFLLRCLTQEAKRCKSKLFLIAADFDGAFDRISRSHLIRKLIRFGAGTIFVSCIASMYMSTDNIIFRGKEYVTYKLFSGIKQGLPLSPILFIFYINDIFDMFDSIYGRCIDNVFKLIHILVHADDVTIIASNKENAISKLRTLAHYCKLNYIIPQISKCKFITINSDSDDALTLPFGESYLQRTDYLEILGSHISSTGLLQDDLDLHMSKRYSSCIKFYNFCRENQLSPLSVKIKVLNACVMSSLLYNCETFGNKVPKGLETVYHKLIRCVLQVRSNTPVLLLYVESGLLPVKALIEMRQLKFFHRLQSTISPNSARRATLDFLKQNPSSYLRHYEQLVEKYDNHQEIHTFHLNQVKEQIRNYAACGRSKYDMYLQINPNLEKAPMLQCIHQTTVDMIRFRLGSHNLPIEKGRWNRTPRELRLCTICNILGDEKHVIYNCSLIDRSDLDLSNDISHIWVQPDVFTLFKRIKTAEYL